MKMFLAVVAVLFFASCSKDNDDGSNLPPFDQLITQGNWVVAFYAENGVNKTTDYTGNILKFNTGGTLTATKGANTFTGTWFVTGATHTFSFTVNTFDVALIALGGDWTVISATLTDVQFVDGSHSLTLHKQ